MLNFLFENSTFYQRITLEYKTKNSSEPNSPKAILLGSLGYQKIILHLGALPSYHEKEFRNHNQVQRNKIFEILQCCK